MTRFDPTLAQERERAARNKSLRRRRMLVLLGVVILLCAATPAVVHYGTMAAERIRANRLYRACAAYTVPESTVVWEEDPQLVARLGGYERVDAHDGEAAYFVPDVWRQLNASIGQGQMESWGTLFLHDRTPRGGGGGGDAKLVAVDIAGWSRGGPVVMFARCRTLAPAGPLRLPVEQKIDHPSIYLSPAEGTLRLSAGQPDPNDPSHFTIEYTIDDQPGTIDGWLKADGTVTLEKRQ